MSQELVNGIYNLEGHWWPCSKGFTRVQGVCSRHLIPTRYAPGSPELTHSCSQQSPQAQAFHLEYLFLSVPSTQGLPPATGELASPQVGSTQIYRGVSTPGGGGDSSEPIQGGTGPINHPASQFSMGHRVLRHGFSGA